MTIGVWGEIGNGWTDMDVEEWGVVGTDGRTGMWRRVVGGTRFTYGFKIEMDYDSWYSRYVDAAL